jgi:hypothetical protein
VKGKFDADQGVIRQSVATKQHKISVNDNIYPNLCAPHSAERIFKNAVWIVKGRFLENFIEGLQVIVV